MKKTISMTALALALSASTAFAAPSCADSKLAEVTKQADGTFKFAIADAAVDWKAPVVLVRATDGTVTLPSGTKVIVPDGYTVRLWVAEKCEKRAKWWASPPTVTGG